MPRTDRYRDILKHEHLITPITIVGCGAIGRNVALCLGSMGFDTIRLVDMDVVDDANLGTQGWSVTQVGEKKPEALAREIRERFPGCETDCWVKRVEEMTDGHLDRPAVFMCVDCMDVRKHIFDRLVSLGGRRRCHYLIDTRMAAATGYVWPVHMGSKSERSKWLEHWFPQEEAEPMPCAERATLYCATFAASLAVSNFVSMIRGVGTLAVPTHFNLPANMLTRV